MSAFDSEPGHPPVAASEAALYAHKLRFLCTQLRIYPETHSMVQDAARSLCAAFLQTTGKQGQLRIDFGEGRFRANGRSIAADDAESQHAGTLSEWFVVRGVKAILLDSGLREDELLRAIGWLCRGTPPLLRQTLASQPPEDLRLESLQLNPKGPALEAEDIEATDLGFEDDPTDFPVDPSKEQDSRPDHSGALFAPTPPSLEAGDPTPKALETQERSSTTHQPATPSYDWSKADPRAFDAIAERLAAGQGGRARLPPAHLAKEAWAALSNAQASNLGAYLATELPVSPAGQALRLTLLAGLRADPHRAASVLRTLVQLLTSDDDEGAVSTPAVLRAIEELSLAALRAGALEDVVEASDLAHRLSHSAADPALRSRAATALRFVATRDLLRALLQTLEIAGPRNQELVFELLRILGRFSVDHLIEELAESQQRPLRLRIVGLLTHIGKSAIAEGKDPAEWLSPVVDELQAFDRRPWYVTRNLVSILSRVESQTFYAFLLRLMEADADPRVLREAVRGLIAADTDTARALVRTGVFEGRIQDPTALYEAVPFLHRIGPSATLAGLADLLGQSLISDDASGAALLGLAEGGGSAAIDWLAAIVRERTSVLKRASYRDAVRAAAARALAAIDDPRAKSFLTEFAEDPSSILRAAITPLTGLEPEPARALLRRELGLHIPAPSRGSS